VRPRAAECAAVFLGASLPGIASAHRALLETAIRPAHVELTGELFERLPAFKKAWRQVARLGEFHRDFVGRVPIDEEWHGRWSAAALAFIEEFYREVPSPGAKAAVDFSALFAVVVALAPPVESVKCDVAVQDVMGGERKPGFSMTSIERQVDTAKHYHLVIEAISPERERSRDRGCF
jgi:hypothetical protein